MDSGSAYQAFGHWGMLAFTVGFVVLILLGGIWLKNLEKKSRDRESLEPRD